MKPLDFVVLLHEICIIEVLVAVKECATKNALGISLPPIYHLSQPFFVARSFKSCITRSSGGGLGIAHQVLM